jgi:hypothetical protein
MNIHDLKEQAHQQAEKTTFADKVGWDSSDDEI